MVCNSNNYNVVLTLRSMIFDLCSFHEDTSFCIYCLTKMTIPKVAQDAIFRKQRLVAHRYQIQKELGL